ncbi:MAG: hormogonium polysaccharide biosynthesis protein HpsA [Stigonema ocellatum SAG 48.90 = DSM 106950]|nr:hormogonium polysaccharide biosynthesis protein HpsA [Stigonema ocellatum SAG 48.90 = DSM 106950]
MTKHRYTRQFTHFFKKFIKFKKTVKILILRLLRIVLVSRRRRYIQGGFVLPTTVMLLLVVILVVTTLIFRTFSRTSQVISERQQQVIYNLATPAIDRAKSKLEYLFRQDSRLPAGIPSDSTIQSLLEAPTSGTDNYTLPDETRLANFNDANGKRGIGWYFTQNGKTIAYSIIFKKQATTTGTNTTSLTDSALNKASYFVVRNGPVNTNNSSTGNCGSNIVLVSNEKDWQPITSATVAKTFQVTAFAVENADKPNRSVATLELQQDRQADKGNKWGAYFRYDLELFHGSATNFRWNGAMHSDGSMFLAPFGAFQSYLISSPASCVNTSSNDSKITVSRYTNGSSITFEGEVLVGRLAQQPSKEFGGSSTIDIYNGSQTPTSVTLTKDTDSVIPPDAPQNTKLPVDFALNPQTLLTQDVFQSRGSDTTNTSYRDPNWQTGSFVTGKRIFNEEATPPYLDDTYRADDRYGPNPTYDGLPLASSQVKIPTGNKVGDLIPATDTNYSQLTRNTPADPTSPDALGLDGYWERRAVTGGLRVIVGQRLELGNPLATALSLPSGREHEFLQRRTQKDNVAAVQATAVYHYKSGSGTTPVACMATTVHPGTAETLKRSATFETITFKQNVVATDPITSATTTTQQNYSPIISDFFTGRGTNGWEFSVPTSSTALTTARTNLAYFAGDPKGAFPPTQEAAGGVTHPYFELTKYGDFSNLRRANSGSSLADQSYKDTANCMLGMLAYNISYLNKYDYSLNWETTDSTVKLLDDLNTALSTAAASVLANSPAEAAIAALDASSVTNKNKLVQLARLVATKEQVKRDRTNGTGYSCDFTTVDSTATSLNKLCPTDSKYQALYYIFPTTTHAEDRTADTYITGTGVNPTASTNYTAITDADISTISISPNTTWQTPRTDVTTSASSISAAPNSNASGLNNLVKYVDATNSNKYYQVAFKDAALFNGREMMNVRTLDMDLNLLRTTDAPGGDKWLPINDNTATNPNAPPPNGLVYAFREDAVREDAIARPAGSTGSKMNAVPYSTPSDPPINSSNGITTKSVDYLPDPDRRPYGFRLKNASRLDRGTNTAGMSFVSDNPVYIQGDLNLHSTDGTNTDSNLLEEFKNDPPANTTADARGKLKTDWSNFYTRDRKDERFAIPSSDTWRPTEVLGDAVTILSNNFCDGSIEDGIVNLAISPSFSGLSNYGCSQTAATYTSYFNQNRPWLPLNNTTAMPSGDRAPNNNTWVRENPFDSNSPIAISPDGKPFYCTSTTVPCPTTTNTKQYQLINTSSIDSNFPQSYIQFSNQGCTDNRKCMGIAGSKTIVNAIIVQNIIPSQVAQSYGGFHNFPRLIENWNGKTLSLAGAFIQLRFSTQATGSFDQDAWESTQSPSAQNEYTWYYSPPTRLWGYDVALQYQTAGPVARRFTVTGNTRSEVYRELSLDDPYVKNLRCAKKDTSGNPIDSAAICS